MGVKAGVGSTWLDLGPVSAEEFNHAIMTSTEDVVSWANTSCGEVSARSHSIDQLNILPSLFRGAEDMFTILGLFGLGLHDDLPAL
jgi:hypothetical protein